MKIKIIARIETRLFFNTKKVGLNSDKRVDNQSSNNKNILILVRGDILEGNKIADREDAILLSRNSSG